MSTYVQICLIWLIYGVAMLTLEVRAGLLERLYKDLLQLGQPLSPTRNALQEKKRKDYTFWCQFNEDPGLILGCPGECPSQYKNNECENGPEHQQQSLATTA